MSEFFDADKQNIPGNEISRGPSLPRKTYRFFKELILELFLGRRGMIRKIRGDLYRIIPRHRFILEGQYDGAVSEFLEKRVKPGSLCVNVGANIGLYALQFARWTGREGRVFAFEPSPFSARDLRRHGRMNGFENLIVEEKAVSDHSGKADFFFVGTEQMNSLGAPNPLMSNAGKISVAVTTLDQYFQDNALEPDWLLVDVEGFEIAVLRGSIEIIGKLRNRLGLVVEMHPNAWHIAGTGKQDLVALLADLKLEPIALNGQKDCLEEYGMVWLKYT